MFEKEEKRSSKQRAVIMKSTIIYKVFSGLYDVRAFCESLVEIHKN